VQMIWHERHDPDPGHEWLRATLADAVPIR
jgi:hypothetical protein